MKTSNKNTNEYFNLKQQYIALNRGTTKKVTLPKEKLISFIQLTNTPKLVTHSEKVLNSSLKNKSNTKNKSLNKEHKIIDKNKSFLNDTNKHSANKKKKLNFIIKEYKHKLHILNSFKHLNHNKNNNMIFITNNNNNNNKYNNNCHFKNTKHNNYTPIKHNNNNKHQKLKNEILNKTTYNNRSDKHFNKIKYNNNNSNSNNNNKSCLISEPSFQELLPKQTSSKSPNRKQIQTIIKHKHKCINSLINITNVITSNLCNKHKVNLIHQQHNSLLLSTTSSNTTTHNNSVDIKHKKCYNYYNNNHNQHPISVKLKPSKYYTPYNNQYLSRTSENDNTCLNTTDENILIHSPKLINYTKQIYSNNYISSLFLSLFNSHKVCTSLLSYLSNNDLPSFSLINKKLHSISKAKIHSIIVNNILHQHNNSNNIHIKLWQYLLSKTSIHPSSSPEKEYIINSVKQSSYYNEIVTDIQRMRNITSTNASKLTHILNTYSNYNTNIGYAQGINYITYKLLLKYNNNEITVFHALDSIITLLNYDSVIGIKHKLNWHLNVIDILISEYVPTFHRYLQCNELSHDMFTVSWLITLFSNVIEHDNELYLLWEVMIIFKWEFIYLFIVNVIMFINKTVHDWNAYEFTLHMKDIIKCDEFHKEFPIIIRKAVEMMESVKWGKIKFKLNLC